MEFAPKVFFKSIELNVSSSKDEDIGKESGPPMATLNNKRVVKAGSNVGWSVFQFARGSASSFDGVESNMVLEFGAHDVFHEDAKEILSKVVKEAE